MEVTPYIQKYGGHAASLLASLNRQRGQAQFCDCVVRQSESPGQLYLAHRCVLAASSPVLASILSSSGALVELQAPCLSDSVLVLLLDYIYTGALPSTLNKQHYYSLLTAACHLQMDELQETLRTEVNAAGIVNTSTGAENQPHKDNNNTNSNTLNTCSKHLPLSGVFSGNSQEQEEQYSDDMDTCTSGSKNGANPVKNAGSGCIASESTRSGVIKGNCRQVNYLTPQDLIQNIPCIAKVHGMSGVDKGGNEDQFHLVGTVKSETWQMSTEEEFGRTVEKRGGLFLDSTAEVHEEETSKVDKMQRPCLTVKSKAEETQTSGKEEDKINHFPFLHLSTSYLKDNLCPSQCSPSSCPSSTYPCCGAVPVIRHSSTATMVEATTIPPHHPVSQTPDSKSGSADSVTAVEDFATKHKNNHGAQSQDFRNNKNHTATQSCDFKSRSDQCGIQDLCYKSSNADHIEYMGNGLSHITDEDDYHAHRDSIQNKNQTNTFRDDSVMLNKNFSFFPRGLRYKTDLSSGDFPSKHQQLDCSNCHNVSAETAAEEQPIHSQDLRAVVSLPVQDSGAGSDTHCKNVCLEEETKEAHSYSSKCPAGVGRQDSHSDLYGSMKDWYPNLQRAERRTTYVVPTQREHDDKDTAIDNVTVHTSVEHDNTLTFTVPLDSNMSDPTYNVVMKSYSGQLHYHCLPKENTHLSHADSDHKHSHPTHPNYSDQSSDDEEVGPFDSPGLSPLRQHFTPADQVLLLDISAKPAELLVSYRHRSDKQERWIAFGQKDTFGNGLADDDREQRHEAKSAAEDDEKKIISKPKFVGEGSDEAKVETWVDRTNEEQKSVGKDQSRSGAEVIHNAGFVEDDSQTATLTVCSPPGVPDFAQAPVSSSLSVCIPSTLSASVPTNISAHLSAPVHHPFQCSLCDRSFSQRGSLNRHVRSHLGVRPFPCPRCPMTFSRQYRVSEHMRVHQRCVIGSDFQNPPSS